MRRSLVSLLSAEAVSLTGSRIATVAVPWLVLTTTGSATRVGVVAFAQMLPVVLAGLLGGPLVDRVGPRRTAIGCDAGSAVLVGSIPLLYAADLLPFGRLVAIVAVAGLLGGCGDTAKRALLPIAIAQSGTAMVRGTAFYDGISRLAILLGMPLGGVLIAVVGAPAVLLVDAGSFALCAVVVAVAVRTPAPARGDDVPAAGEGYVAALQTGFGFLLRQPLLVPIVGLLFVTNLVDQAYGAVFVPVWVRDIGVDPAVLGLLGGSLGLGAVIGNAVYTVLATRLPRRMTFAVCMVLAGSPRLFALGLSDSVWLMLGVAFGAGLAVAAVNPILSALAYERIPAHLHGRVLGVIGALSFAGVPLGGLLAGVAVDGVGLRLSLLGGALLYLAITLTPFVLPQWRALDQPPDAVRTAGPLQDPSSLVGRTGT
ncbi:MFS transporter [Micromonosporaceae bacterium Da 78-11]